jgi:hypothetical protein
LTAQNKGSAWVNGKKGIGKTGRSLYFFIAIGNKGNGFVCYAYIRTAAARFKAFCKAKNSFSVNGNFGYGGSKGIPGLYGDAVDIGVYGVFEGLVKIITGREEEQRSKNKKTPETQAQASMNQYYKLGSRESKAKASQTTAERSSSGVTC